MDTTRHIARKKTVKVPIPATVVRAFGARPRWFARIDAPLLLEVEATSERGAVQALTEKVAEFVTAYRPSWGHQQPGLWPTCQFDDCDDDGEAQPAAALVPMMSTGMSTPYDWVLACASCAATASSAAPTDQQIPLHRSTPETTTVPRPAEQKD